QRLLPRDARGRARRQPERRPTVPNVLAGATKNRVRLFFARRYNLARPGATLKLCSGADHIQPSEDFSMWRWALSAVLSLFAVAAPTFAQVQTVGDVSFAVPECG